MRVTVTIPKGENRELATYTFTCDDDARVMQVLHMIHEELDPGLAFRTNFCKRGSCGLCMVLVNKKAVKACKAPVEEVMLIEPLPRPLVRDLVVTRAINA